MEGRSTKVRLVRCPKCLKLLVEYADIPVYQCGGCRAVLRGKNSIASGENANSGSLEINRSQSLSDNGFSDIGSTSSAKQMIACSTSAHSSELEHQEKETMLSNVCSSYSSAEHNQENGETSGENGIEENGYDTNQLAVRSDASQSQPDEGIHSKTEAEESLKLLQQHSGSSKVMDKVEEPPDSISHSVASEEDTVERGSSDGLDLSVRSLATRSSHAYDGSISSSDDGYKYNNHAPERFLLRSRRTFRQPRVLDMADIKGKGGEEVLGSGQMTTDLEADLQARTLPSKLSNERHGPDIMRSFNTKRDEFSSKYGMYELDREISFDSEDFHSVQNWVGQENGPTSSLSRGSHFQHDFFKSKSSKYLRYDRMDSLRNLDELKNQVQELYDQIGGGKPYFRGTNGWQPFYHNSEHQPPQHFNSHLLHRPPEALYGPRQIASQQYQFSQMPFSGESCCSCLYSRQEDQRLQLQPNHCIDNVCRAHAYSLCSHSSTTGSSRTLLDHEQEMLHCNEKRKPKKNHCRPIFGGAPFIICYNCFKLLQLPADFLILKRRLHKLHCAACSKVLTLSFPAAKACISPPTPIKEVHPHIEETGSTDLVTGSVSHSNDCPLDDPVSISEEYGLSFMKSFSTEADHMLHVSRNSSAGKIVKQTSGSPLHRLMGYSSPGELLYQCWDIDEGYESIESVVPHSNRPSQESMQSMD